MVVPGVAVLPWATETVLSPLVDGWWGQGIARAFTRYIMKTFLKNDHATHNSLQHSHYSHNKFLICFYLISKLNSSCICIYHVSIVDFVIDIIIENISVIDFRENLDETKKDWWQLGETCAIISLSEFSMGCNNIQSLTLHKRDMSPL